MDGGIFMLTQYMWERFKMTGSVSEYLVYAEEKQLQEEEKEKLEQGVVNI